ncbi:MAG: cytochrome d ubiquinol oxidase subunit II [Parvibaculum sp.]|uniref:cytochrome d ubiquinol oxidase subunit II n=1 Tax=Parvibaculum sp. TaxID=2024848 RepID=UPI0025D864F5|nr:cytochrome d ubiquinol oxidase subunit II [Parvibaculum sp.]MCE9650168.1 cytochrome d ubiquinol oxidase subunit II [Parvibaculum sp.]
MTDLLPFIAAGVIATGILLYVVLDGFDLGVGILFPFAPDHTARTTMMNSVAPVWDGNETWLVLGGGGLMVFFPMAYAIVLPAFYIPIMGLLFALIFRGVAFEFRHTATTSKYIWDRAFFGGSVTSAFMQGLLLGGLIQGVTVEKGIFTGGLFDWFSPFSVLTGIGVVSGYALLGATWLVLKTEKKTQEWARRAAMVAGGGVIVAMGAVSVLTPLMSPAIEARWFSGAQVLFLAPVPLATLGAFAALYWSLISGRERLPFVFAIGLFLLGFLGLGVSLWPHIVPPSVTIAAAAAPDKTIIFGLVGVAITLPMILFYTWYAYSVFKGKAAAHGGYGDE